MIMAATLKSIVSKKKCRYKEGKYDLDLTYISERIIAMGYPAEKVESIYRNDYHNVKEFLDKKHPDHYWVYNLCSEKERQYDKKKFDGRVSYYAFDDHHPPDFSLIQPFCDEVKAYLDKDDRNRAVVHCKAGKGRTGVMICCYLLFMKSSPDAESVLSFYGQKRTTDQKGVTIPSQRRYITYYDAMNREGLKYKPVKLYLKDIVLDPMPNFSNAQSYVYFEVTQRGRRETYVSRHILCRKNERTVSLSVNPPLLLSEDVKIEFISKPKFGETFFGKTKPMQNLAKGEKMFHFWLNTFFVDMELDGGLAHDLTETGPIGDGRGGPGGPHHVHHASGSSEDSSADDIPLRPVANGHAVSHVSFRDSSRENVNLRQTSVPISAAASAVTSAGNSTAAPLATGNGTVPVGIVSENSSNLEVTNLIKHASISDDHLLQDRRSRQTENFPCNSNNTNLMGPLSTSDENTASEADSSSSTTAESFNQQRLRHTSMPQARVSSSSGLGGPEHHLHHPPLEASLSHCTGDSNPGMNQANKHQSSHFFSRPHATITSNSAASLEMAAASQLQVPIKGKLLSLRLKKGQIDKAHKDKTSQRFPDNFSVTLFLVKPEDQSEKLLDYSLYSPAFLMQSMPDQVPNTITTSGQGHSGSGNLSSNSSNEKFTVESVTGLPGDLRADQQQLTGRAGGRQRPLTGESGASSSSATPSLKSVEQSSQDSVNSSDGEGSDPDFQFKKSCNLRSSVAPSSGVNVKQNSAPIPPQKQPPQSTAI